QFLEAVEAVPAIAHHLAGLADVPELLGQLQQPDLRSDNLLLLCHRGLPHAGGRAAVPALGENRVPPSGSYLGNYNCPIKSQLKQNSQPWGRPTLHQTRSRSRRCCDSITYRSLRPLPCSTRMTMRALSMSETLSEMISEARNPAP